MAPIAAASGGRQQIGAEKTAATRKNVSDGSKGSSRIGDTRTLNPLPSRTLGVWLMGGSSPAGKGGDGEKQVPNDFWRWRGEGGDDVKMRKTVAPVEQHEHQGPVNTLNDVEVTCRWSWHLMMKVKVETHVRRLPCCQVPTPPWGAGLQGGGRGGPCWPPQLSPGGDSPLGWRPAATQAWSAPLDYMC